MPGRWLLDSGSLSSGAALTGDSEKGELVIRVHGIEPLQRCNVQGPLIQIILRRRGPPLVQLAAEGYLLSGAEAFPDTGDGVGHGGWMDGL